MIELIVLLLVGFVIIAPVLNAANRARNVRYELSDELKAIADEIDKSNRSHLKIEKSK